MKSENDRSLARTRLALHPVFDEKLLIPLFTVADDAVPSPWS